MRVAFPAAELDAARGATVTVSFDRLANFGPEVAALGPSVVVLAEERLAW